MKIFFTLLAISFTWMTTLVHAQGWQHRFGGTGTELANTVLQTADGGFITAGSSSGYGPAGNNIHVIKTTSQGKLQWQRVIGTAGEEDAYGIVQNSSGEYYVAGQTTGAGAGGIDIYLVKLSGSGAVIWTNTYGGALEDYTRGMVITAANDVVIAGSTKSSGAGGNDAYLIKVNPSGTLLWSKTFGKTGNEIAWSISKVHDGGFLISGSTNSFSTNYGYMVRTNSNGDSLWTKAINIGSLSGASLYGGTELISNTAFAFSGYGGSLSYGHMVTVLSDLNGVVTSTVYSTLLADGGNGITPTSDGGFATVSQYCNFGCRTVLTKFSSAGTFLWNEYYITGSGSSYATFSCGKSIQQTSDGGFILAGSTYLPGVLADILIIKTDVNGVVPGDYVATVGAAGPTQFCSGGSVQLSAPLGYEHYQWLQFVGNNVTWLSSTDTSSITATTTGYYQCVMTNADGIYFTYSISITVTAVPTATITASGPLAFCGPIQNLTLTAPTVANTTYSWKLNGNVISGATGTTYMPTVVGSYTVTMTNNCGAATSAPAVVNNNLQPTANINTTSAYVMTVDGNVCDPAYLAVANQTGMAYQWYLNGSPFTTGSYEIYANLAGSYSVTVTNSCGSSTSAIATVTSYSSTTDVGSFDNVTGCGIFPVTLNSPFSYSGYQWYNNGVLIPGATSDTYQASMNGFYTCDIVIYCAGFNWATTANGLQVNLSGTPIPSISASGPTTFCSGSVTLNASPAGATYQWQKDYVNIPGATSQSYSASTTGNYRCRITNGACGLVSSNVIFVKVGLPIGTISTGNSTICDGNFASLNLSTTDYALSFTAQWRRNGVDIPGANSTNYQASLAGTYDCVVTNACGILTTNSLVISVTTLNATVTPSGTAKLCPGSSLNLTVASGAGNTYQWYKSNNAISGATSTSYLVTQPGSYYVRVSGSGCVKNSSSVNVVQETFPSLNIWPSTLPEFCNTGSVVLNANTRSDFSYTWTRNGNLVPGATASSYTATQGGKYICNITDSLGCVASTSSLTVNSSGIGNFSINAAGPVSFCSGNSVLLNSTIVGSSYQWSRGTTAIPGATGVSYLADSSSVYFVRVTNAQGCSGSASLSVTEFSPVVINSTITNPACGLSNGSISVTITGATYPISLLWSTGATTNNISNLGPGTYTLIVTNGNGCTSQSSMTLTQAGQTATVTATGPTTVCAGNTVTLNANTGTGLTYQWKKYGNIIVGATSSTYNATTAGPYKVVVTNSSGCSGTSIATTVTINPLPVASITATGATTFCPGGSVQLNANTGTGLTYQWKKYSNVIAGANSSTYTASSAGQFKVTVTNANGCSKNSNAITVTILAAPVSAITANGPTTFCAGDSVRLTANTGAGLTYQWRKGANNIAGSTSINYYAKSAGNYKCTVTNAAGCTKNSNVIAVSVPCRIGILTPESAEDEISVYPNPSNDVFYLHGTYSGEIIITDLTGKMVQFERHIIDEQTITISGLSTGIYFLRISGSDNSRVFKLVKM